MVLLVVRGGARVVEVDALVWSVGVGMLEVEAMGRTVVALAPSGVVASAGMVGALVNVTLWDGGDVGCC